MVKGLISVGVVGSLSSPSVRDQKVANRFVPMIQEPLLFL